MDTEIMETETVETETVETESKKFYKSPQFWAIGVGVLILVCILIFVLVELGRAKPPKIDPDSTLSDNTASSTENTLPPPEANPIGLGDFELAGDYLTCLSTPSVLGIDVSEWQGEIDWQQVKDAGVEFAMIRVGWRGSEGGKLAEDTYAQANYAGAAAAGIKVGAYIFSQAVTVDEAVEEANFLLEKIRDWNVEMPVVFDWEFIDADARTATVDSRTLTECVKAFCNTVTLAGHTPMFYFNQDLSFEGLYLRELTDYPFWLAYYDTVLNYPYKVDMWQYTQSGSVPGIATDVDINLYFPWEQ